jgi:hypothetical protein
VHRDRGHARFVLCPQELGISVPVPELRYQVLIFLLECRKLFLQLLRGGRSSLGVSVEIDPAKSRDNEGMIFCRDKGGVQGNWEVILVQKRKGSKRRRIEIYMRKAPSGGSGGTRSFGCFGWPLTGIKWSSACRTCGLNRISAGLHMFVHAFLAMKMPYAPPHTLFRHRSRETISDR